MDVIDDASPEKTGGDGKEPFNGDSGNDSDNNINDQEKFHAEGHNSKQVALDFVGDSKFINDKPGMNENVLQDSEMKIPEVETKPGCIEGTVEIKTEKDSGQVDENTVKAVPSIPGELMEYREGSGENQTSSESSDSSDDESGPESGFQPGSSLSSNEEDANADGSRPKGKKQEDEAGKRVPAVNRTMKTKGELGLEDLPPIDDLKITVDKDVSLYKIGSVSSCIGLLVLVQAVPESPALNVDSVLFSEDRQVLGQVFEILGPVAKPLYTVRFNSVEDIEAKGIKEGNLVFYAPDKDEFTKFIFLTELKKMKGSDASWENNNEPPAKFLDYSDDESERRAKRGDKGGEREKGDNSGKPTKRQKERGGKFNNQDGHPNDNRGNDQKANKRGRKGFQSWPPKSGDFSENPDFPPPPAPHKEFPNDYAGFQIQQARPFQPDNSGFPYQGPRPSNERFQGPPPRNPHFRPPVQNNQPFRHHQDFRGPPNHGDPRFGMNPGNPPFFNGTQPPPGGPTRPPFMDQTRPQFGGGPQFNSRFPSQGQQNFPSYQQNPVGNLQNTSNDQQGTGPNWNNTSQHSAPGGPPFFGQAQNTRPSGPPMPLGPQQGPMGQSQSPFGPQGLSGQEQAPSGQHQVQFGQQHQGHQAPFGPPNGPPGQYQQPQGPAGQHSNLGQPQGLSTQQQGPFGQHAPFGQHHGASGQPSYNPTYSAPPLQPSGPQRFPPPPSAEQPCSQAMAMTRGPPRPEYSGSGPLPPGQPSNLHTRPPLVDQRLIQRQT